MSHFGGPLDLRQMGRQKWMTLATLVYTSDLLGKDIVVSREFITDLASVPRLPFAYLLTGDRARGPAVIHDWLYQHPEWDNREIADSILLEAMAVDQPALGFDAESLPTRNLIWSGVRAGGWYPWRQHRDRRAELNPVWTLKEGWPPPPSDG